MNYYHRHLGDFVKDTAHLSALQVGIYNLLLDRYYASERPIPASEAYQVARARNRDERKAVDGILRDFFQKAGKVWRNKRCDKEIEKANSRIEAARSNGLKGGRPKTQQEPSGFHSANPSPTQMKALQSPTSNNQQKNSDSETINGLSERRKQELGAAVSDFTRHNAVQRQRIWDTKR